MASAFVDIHPHIISSDASRYPRAPLFGVQSDWSQTRPVTIEGLIAAMDEAGVDKAAIVQASTCYGFDNSYLCDSIARFPGRFTGVGSVDLFQPDAPQRIKYWMGRGITGIRQFTGGSTAAFDASLLSDERAFPAWEYCQEVGLSMCLQADSSGLSQVVALAKRFPKVKILIDHLARPDTSDGPPYTKAAPLFALAATPNIYLKLSPRIFVEVSRGKGTADTFFPKLVETFTSRRIAWGSNFPTSEGKMNDNLAIARKSLSCLSKEDQDWIFAKTAQTIYPAVAD
jgi:L-fuconolactonase